MLSGTPFYSSEAQRSVGESLAAWVSDVIHSFGYAGVAFLMLVENLFPPIPSEVILPLTGFLVEQGILAFLPALIVATGGSLAGALVLYALGRWGGEGSSSATVGYFA